MDKFPQGGTGAWTGGPARRRALQDLCSEAEEDEVRALVVADDDSSALYFARVLTRAGCHCRRAGLEDAVAAVTLGEVDLLVIYWAWTERAPLESAAAAREADPELAILLVSGEESSAVRQLASSVGVDEVLSAPVPPRLLTERVRLLSVRTARERRLARIRLARSPAAVPPAAGDPLVSVRAAGRAETDPLARIERELEWCYEARYRYIACWTSPGPLTRDLSSSAGRVVTAMSASCGVPVFS